MASERADLGEHRYRLAVRWDGNLGTGTSGYRDYSRNSTVAVAGKPPLHASADTPFRGDADRWNPEDMLLAALSECHMMSFLYACVTLDIVVVAYEDEAEATLSQEGDGGAFTEAVLHPVVTVADESMVERVAEAHRLAHDWCFIASSVNFPVRHEAVTRVS